ncbi:plasmid mobilization protein [Mucilaginibacter psychrotolerans]|uniref:Plasmid mobilization relaxosome protein MobC n=1 Tax=Mucilaginibacter psychrotolerans TaxID=1524096 RepID=A0A4Y8SHN5_9SPHI|nr:plasmid mobilization relaxosome protein MobC [Mucilaginibacter psychrotolerans]TFF37926.1 plasmid mobilization relaxosome protein MobC [Mucilaginibacter psychrotolerans]
MERQMKRTPKNGGEKRDAVFRFRVSLAEKKIIEQNAAREGMSVSDYIRKKADEASGGFDRNTLIRLLAETGKQGSNLNQIAKAMNIWVNTGNDPRIPPGMLRHCIDEITRLSREIMEVIKYGYRRKNQG